MQAHRNNWQSTPDVEVPQKDTGIANINHLLNNSQPPKAIATAQILSNETTFPSTAADEDFQDKDRLELLLKDRYSVSYDSYPRAPGVNEELSTITENGYLAPLLVLQAC